MRTLTLDRGQARMLTEVLAHHAEFWRTASPAVRGELTAYFVDRALAAAAADRLLDATAVIASHLRGQLEARTAAATGVRR